MSRKFRQQIHRLDKIERSFVFVREKFHKFNLFSLYQAIDFEFMDHIKDLIGLKCKVVEKMREYETANKDLSLKVSALTALNSILSKQNDGTKQELNAKTLELDEVKKKYQMLLEKKASLRMKRMNFRNRLQNLFDDVALSDAESSDQESSYVTEGKSKRSLLFDSDTSSSAKRHKNFDSSSARNDKSTNGVQQDEGDESDDQKTQMNSGLVEENVAATDGITDSTDDGKLESFCVPSIFFFSKFHFPMFSR